MGVLVYDGESFDFDDRTLAHLQAVITIKLRRREPFLLSWHTDQGEGAARTSVWIDNAIPLRYELDAEAAQRLDPTRLDALLERAGRTSGLVLGRDAFGPEPSPGLPRTAVA